MNYDITFCANKDCKDKRCIRHHTNAPKNIYITQAYLFNSEYCPTYNYEDNLATTLLDEALKNPNNMFTDEELNLLKTLVEIEKEK